MARPSKSDPLMTSGQIAEMFSVTPYTARLWLREGKIKAIQINGRWRARRSEVEVYANQKHGDDDE